MRQNGNRRFLLLVQTGKHADCHVKEMGKRLGLDTQFLYSFLLEQMIRKLKKEPSSLPWIAKLFLEIGEPLVHLTHVSLKQTEYFTLLRFAHARRLAVEDLAGRLLAVGVPFWFCKTASDSNLTGAALQEELARGVRFDLAIEFAKL